MRQQDLGLLPLGGSRRQQEHLAFGSHRILALEKLGAVFNQVAFPLQYTPRKFVIHSESSNLIIIETDHNAYTEATKAQRKQQMAEVAGGAQCASAPSKKRSTQDGSGHGAQHQRGTTAAVQGDTSPGTCSGGGAEMIPFSRNGQKQPWVPLFDGRTQKGSVRGLLPPSLPPSSRGAFSPFGAGFQLLSWESDVCWLLKGVDTGRRLLAGQQGS